MCLIKLITIFVVINITPNSPPRCIVVLILKQHISLVKEAIYIKKVWISNPKLEENGNQIFIEKWNHYKENEKKKKRKTYIHTNIGNGEMKGKKKQGKIKRIK